MRADDSMPGMALGLILLGSAVGGALVGTSLVVIDPLKARQPKGPPLLFKGTKAFPLNVTPQATADLTAGLQPMEGFEIPPVYTAHPVDPPPPALRVFGDDVHDAKATYRPDYLKSKGCKNFYWGLCFEDFIRELGKQTPNAMAARDLALRVIYSIYPVAGKIAEWITKNICLIFKFPLRLWGDQYGNSGWEIARKAETVADNHPSPLPYREGYHRIWVRKRPHDSSSRNENIVRILFSRADFENDKSIEIELASTYDIRGMLRLDPHVTGALNAKQLAGAGCGKSKFWQARRKVAMEHFK